MLPNFNRLKFFNLTRLLRQYQLQPCLFSPRLWSLSPNFLSRSRLKKRRKRNQSLDPKCHKSRRACQIKKKSLIQSNSRLKAQKKSDHLRLNQNNQNRQLVDPVNDSKTKSWAVWVSMLQSSTPYSAELSLLKTALKVIKKTRQLMSPKHTSAATKTGTWMLIWSPKRKSSHNKNKPRQNCRKFIRCSLWCRCALRTKLDPSIWPFLTSLTKRERLSLDRLH